MTNIYVTMKIHIIREWSKSNFEVEPIGDSLVYLRESGFCTCYTSTTYILMLKKNPDIKTIIRDISTVSYE